ncbi:helix-turn-helix domain-containing protein, partial [Acidobacteriota bacterium]
LPLDRPASRATCREDLSLKELVAKSEKEIILECLKENNWHIRRTSEKLKLERSHLYKKMKHYDINKEAG